MRGSSSIYYYFLLFYFYYSSILSKLEFFGSSSSNSFFYFYSSVNDSFLSNSNTESLLFALLDIELYYLLDFELDEEEDGEDVLNSDELLLLDSENYSASDE